MNSLDIDTKMVDASRAFYRYVGGTRGLRWLDCTVKDERGLPMRVITNFEKVVKNLFWFRISSLLVIAFALFGYYLAIYKIAVTLEAVGPTEWGHFEGVRQILLGINYTFIAVPVFFIRLGRETGAELVDCWIRSNWKFPEFEELVRIVDLCSLDNSSGLHSLKWLIGTGTEAYYESNIPKHVIQACDAELKNMAYHVKLRELEGKSSDPSLQGVKESMHVLFNACRRLGIIAWETNIRFYWDHAITKLAAEKLSAAVPVAS